MEQTILSEQLELATLSPDSKTYLSRYGGGEDEDESDDEADLLLTSEERHPSADSTRAILTKCFASESFVVSKLGLAKLAATVSHPRELHGESWEILNALAASAKGKNTLICKMLANCVKHVGLLLSLDFFKILEMIDEFRESIMGEFVLKNDQEEELRDFTFVGIRTQAELVDDAKSTHDCAKVNKDRLCMLIKTTVECLLNRVVALSAFSIKTPLKHNTPTFTSSAAEHRMQAMESNLVRLTSEIAAVSEKHSRDSLALGQKVEANSDMLAVLIQQLRGTLSTTLQPKSTPEVIAHEKSLPTSLSSMSSAETLASSGLSGIVATVTTTDAKGNESSDVLSCMFVSGIKPKSSRRRATFLESDWNLTNLLETSRCWMPGISVEVVSPAKGDLKVDLRSVFKAGSDMVVRKVSFLPPVSQHPSSKLSKPQINLLSHDGLPRSLPLMIKFLYGELEALRLFGEYLPTEMDRLIESEIGKFVNHMASLFAALCDSSDSVVCSSPDGVWRGMVHLFYHQYLDAFSSGNKGMYQIFYPEMLCYAFEANSAYLWRQYAWKTSQLTGAVHNYLKFACPRCQLTKLAYSACITPSCLKAREDEATLHVFVDARGKPIGIPIKT
jgi:hypothetical protein